jgi:hypothetical protein
MTIALNQVRRILLVAAAAILFSSTIDRKAQAQTENPAPEVIKVRLETSGDRNEWIRIEKDGNTARLMHTTRAKTGFSRAINSVGLPISFHRWHDHPTKQVVFVPDTCTSQQYQELSARGVVRSSGISSSPRCVVTGTDSVILPEGMDISRGQFTIEYQDGDLSRSVTFRVPSEQSDLAEEQGDRQNQPQSSEASGIEPK